MIGLLGRKLGMTQIFNKDGRQIPVTVLEIGPCTVLQTKSKETDGYQAVQLGFSDQKEKSATKPELGHFKKANVSPKYFVREIRTASLEGLAPGTVLKVNNFSVGDWVDVTGTSIGRGFQGVVKRHHFKGGLSKSHGSMMGRVPGSIGASSFPSRVVKGMRMAGHLGNERVTTQNLRVIKIDLDQNLMAVRGSVPGPKESYVIVREAIKKRRPRTWRMPDQGIEDLKIEEKKVVSKKAKRAEAQKATKPAAPAAKKK
ncbi:MAG: 50S ribosomal protein L3 [Candidatus Omnitrophica bacterium]|nr:50S ribosomal protein L3 [Candidatus Omnitrophota bacterium]